MILSINFHMRKVFHSTLDKQICWEMKRHLRKTKKETQMSNSTWIEWLTYPMRSFRKIKKKISRPKKKVKEIELLKNSRRHTYLILRVKLMLRREQQIDLKPFHGMLMVALKEEDRRLVWVVQVRWTLLVLLNHQSLMVKDQ